YWLSNRAGIDIGFGFAHSSGSERTNTSGADKQTIYGVLGHFGVPLHLTGGKHISLQLIPELNVGWAYSSVGPGQQPDPPPTVTNMGLRIDAGGRLGGEVHFGFMGVPELALEGSIGGFFTYQTTWSSAGGAYARDTNIAVTTASFNNPWDFF